MTEPIIQIINPKDSRIEPEPIHLTIQSSPDTLRFELDLSNPDLPFYKYHYYTPENKAKSNYVYTSIEKYLFPEDHLPYDSYVITADFVTAGRVEKKDDYYTWYEPSSLAITDGPGNDSYNILSDTLSFTLKKAMGINFVKYTRSSSFPYTANIYVPFGMLYYQHGNNGLFWNYNDSFPPVKNFTIWYGLYNDNKFVIHGPNYGKKHKHGDYGGKLHTVSLKTTPQIRLLKDSITWVDYYRYNTKLADFVEIDLNLPPYRTNYYEGVEGFGKFLEDMQKWNRNEKETPPWWIVICDNAPGGQRFFDVTTDQFQIGKVYEGKKFQEINLTYDTFQSLELYPECPPVRILVYNNATPIPAVCELPRLTK